MGIAHNRIYHLINTINRFSLDGAVATLGEQTVTFDHAFLENIADHLGFSLSADDDANEADSESSRSLTLSSRTLFRRLGFTYFESLDISDFEGCTLQFDFNSEMAPENIKDRFNFIYNGGTLEHVFHLPNAFGNIFDMLRVGGVVVHCGPVNGWVEHGFYQFSPTLLLDYYWVNRYEILESYLIQLRLSGDPGKEVWEISAYLPGSLDGISSKQMGDMPYLIYFTARKTEKSTRDVIPQQRYYSTLYGDAGSVSEAPLLTNFEPYELRGGFVTNKTSTVDRNSTITKRWMRFMGK